MYYLILYYIHNSFETDHFQASCPAFSHSSSLEEEPSPLSWCLTCIRQLHDMAGLAWAPAFVLWRKQEAEQSSA